MPLFHTATLLEPRYNNNDQDGIDKVSRSAIGQVVCRMGGLSGSDYSALKQYELGTLTRAMYVVGNTDIDESRRVLFQGRTYRIIYIYNVVYHDQIHHKKVYITSTE